MRLCFNHLTHSSISTLSLHDALPISQSQDGLLTMRTHMSFGQLARRPMRVLVAGVLVALGACSSILDVKNPNDVSESALDRKSTRLNSSHRCISYAVFCLKKKKNK